MKTILVSLKIFLLFTLLTGIVYPLIITGLAQAIFPSQANGSLLVVNNITVGSKLIGQQFDSTEFFSSRPSAISYNPLPSGGSNLGLTNIKLKKIVEERRAKFIAFNQLDSSTLVPGEMLFSSGSGIDPHISPGAALLQTDRIVKARKFHNKQKERLLQIITNLTEISQFGVLGEDRINVLELNLELNKLSKEVKVIN
jgi:K+-transporting ATPase ATPase C chain